MKKVMKFFLLLTIFAMYSACSNNSTQSDFDDTDPQLPVDQPNDDPNSPGGSSATVITFAGTGERGTNNGPIDQATFNWPKNLLFDGQWNLYISDSSNDLIRKINTDGVVTTFAGSGEFGFAEGNGTEASFRWPTCMAMSNSGDIFVSDHRNHMIRKITPNGDVTVVAGTGERGYVDGEALNAQFNDPSCLAIADDGTIYVAESQGHRIRKISNTGVVSTVAGTGEEGFNDGPADEALFNIPYGVIINENGNLLVSDLLNNRIRKIIFD